MPRKKNSRMLLPPKSPLMFAESPKEIPHQFLSPIQCCAFPIHAQSTIVHDTDFLWVSPQFTKLDDRPLRKTRRKCKQKVFAESENLTPNKKFVPLRFEAGSVTDSSCSGTSSSSSALTRSKLKRTVFQDCQPVIQVENISDISVCPEIDDTLKTIGTPSYLQSLFETSPTYETDFGDVLVPNTPEKDFLLTVRERQMKNIKVKTKDKYSL